MICVYLTKYEQVSANGDERAHSNHVYVDNVVVESLLENGWFVRSVERVPCPLPGCYIAGPHGHEASGGGGR